MSEQDFGAPAPPPEDKPQPQWEPVHSPPPAPPLPYGAGQGYPPPPPAGYSQPGYTPQGIPYPPPPPGYPPPGYPPPGYPPPGYMPPGSVPPPYPQSAPGLSMTSAAALSYVTFIPAVIFLVMEPYSRDRFVKFNAWQCILLTAVWIVVSILSIPLAFMHLLGMGIVIHLVVRLVLFLVWLIALINAAQGKIFKIPVIGDLAENLANKP